MVISHLLALALKNIKKLYCWKISIKTLNDIRKLHRIKLVLTSLTNASQSVSSLRAFSEPLLFWYSIVMKTAFVPAGFDLHQMASNDYPMHKTSHAS
jgi:hypothetical protein